MLHAARGGIKRALGPSAPGSGAEPGRDRGPPSGRGSAAAPLSRRAGALRRARGRGGAPILPGVKNTVVLPEPFPGRGFRARLQAELARRCADNPRYSLRAFARDLGIDHSSLSQLLRGKRRLTERLVRELGERLGLPAAELEGCVAGELRRLGAADGAEARLERVRDLTEDALAVVTSPEHHALLELLRLDSFRPDVRWIARVLGIEPDEVNVALQRLVRLGMLELRGERWVDLSGDVTTVLEGVAYEAVRRLSESVRRRAIEDGLAGPPAEREYSATTLAVDRADVPEALERIARFRRELVELLARGRAKDAVYQLELAFLPLAAPERAAPPDPFDERPPCPTP